LSWEEAGETPYADVGDLFAGYDEAYRLERKVAEQKAWDKLTPEQQQARLRVIRQIEGMEKETLGK
jgi:hypothetical protein